jgi:hypothetical protein
VRDAEFVRKALVPRDNHGGRWSLLGQSFGGFCVATYLSLIPEPPLLEAILTGGLPPGIDQACSAEAVYRALFHRVLWQNKKYYNRFPGDVAAVHRIVSWLAAQPGGGVDLPSGSRLTPRGLQTLGLAGLGSGGGFERLHYLLDSFFDDEGATRRRRCAACLRLPVRWRRRRCCGGRALSCARRCCRRRRCWLACGWVGGGWRKGGARVDTNESDTLLTNPQRPQPTKTPNNKTTPKQAA